MNARQQSILQVVIDKGRMSVADLAKMTGVSEVTIRQDLNLLEKRHCCKVSDEAAFCLIQRPYISKTLLT
ncbi:DeoR family transcriptional regulator, partial [Klebsiella pneumoniae]|uniref:DeoR family transcriptional regulator n=1 Tax=Klebsiella pneumoniae TaxID=573 RepID=UPI003D17D32C